MNGIIFACPLLIGFLIDLILGDPHWAFHPVKLIGMLISSLEKYVRKNFTDLKIGGFFLCITVILTSVIIPMSILLLCYKLNLILGIVIEGIMCYYLIAAKCLKDESMKVYDNVRKNDIANARKAVSMIVGRDTERLDEKGIIKAAVETVAENTSDGVTAPILWIALGGAAAGFFYKAVNTMDSMIGYTNEKYKDIGYYAAKLDDILNFIPSRITALVMVISSAILGFDSGNCFRIWKRDCRKHASPNSAQTEAAVAGALNIQLAGDAYYFGELHKKEFIGDDIRPIENEDIRRANRMMYCTSTIILTLSLVLKTIILGVIL